MKPALGSQCISTDLVRRRIQQGDGIVISCTCTDGLCWINCNSIDCSYTQVPLATTCSLTHIPHKKVSKKISRKDFPTLYMCACIIMNSTWILAKSNTHGTLIHGLHEFVYGCKYLKCGLETGTSMMVTIKSMHTQPLW